MAGSSFLRSLCMRGRGGWDATSEEFCQWLGEGRRSSLTSGLSAILAVLGLVEAWSPNTSSRLNFRISRVASDLFGSWFESRVGGRALRPFFEVTEVCESVMEKN